jgi:hypothetical protein
MGSNDSNTGISKRKQTRYELSEDCRIRASIRIQSSDAESAKKDWPGTLVDLSASGAHIQISMAAVAYKGDSCMLKLACGPVKIDVRATLAHYVCSARYSVCGVKFDHSSPVGYQQFFKAVVASSTLKGGTTDSDRPGLYREEYKGPGHTKLVVWRNNKPERAVVGFDYTMGRYAAALTGAGADMLKNKSEVGFRPAPAENGATGGPLTSSQEAEARWEFSLAASNLPKALPPELRKFMRLVS